MPNYSDFVRDDYTRPIPGALAQLFAIDGTTLITTAGTDFDGQFTVSAPDGKYVLQVSYGGSSERSTVIVGNPPEYIGPAGPAGAFRESLEAFQAAPIADGQSTYDGSIWYWTPGDFTDRTDVVQANGISLGDGAWVRQKSTNVTAGAQSYGARGNGTGNDQPAIQRQYDDQGGMLRQRGGVGYLPMGLHPMGASIDLKSFTDWHGDGPRATILDQEANPVNFAAFKWDYTGVQYGFASVSDVGVRGFTHAVLITQDTDEINIRRVHAYKCSSAAVQVTGMLQTGVFEEIKAESCNNGFISSSVICNAMQFRKCDTKNISGEHFHFEGAEGTSVENWRGEGGGLVGAYTLNIINAKQLTFEGGASYMESTHEYAARIVGTTGVVAFKNFHFTGTGARAEGGAGPYKWLTDGTGRLIFENCDSFYKMRVPAHAEIIGACPGIERSGYIGNDSRRPRTVSSSPNFALARFTRLNGAPDAGNLTTFSGTMRLVVSYVDSGGNYTRLDRKIKVSVIGRGATLTINAETKEADDIGVTVSAANLASSIDAGNLSGLLTINLAPLVIGSPVFLASWDIEWSQSASLDQNTFAVELQ